MPDIISSYTYTDGNVLVPASHGQNIFHTASNEGIMSVPNGGLEFANLAAGFTVSPEHVFPEEVVMARQTSYIADDDYLSDALGSDGSTLFFPVAGLNVKFQLPFAAAVLWMWQCFQSAWKPHVRPGDTSPGIAFRAFLDGSQIGHTQRIVWPSVYIFNTAPPE